MSPKPPRLTTDEEALAAALGGFTTAQLLAEATRRAEGEQARLRAAEVAHRATLQWCDQCTSFRPWTGAGDPPKSYNACGRGLRMEFLMPLDTDSPYGESGFGFYNPSCTFFEEAPPPPEPEPPDPKAFTPGPTDGHAGWDRRNRTPKP